MKSTQLLSRWLDIIERAGNKLPHPAMLFIWLTVLVAAASAVLSALGLSAIHPGNGTAITVNNLFSGEGIRWMYKNIVANFVAFPPFGIVLAIVIGIGVAEGSGLFNALVRAIVLKAPKKLITFAVVFAGVMSNVASDAGYLILIPLGAMIFHALGRHPLAGLAAAFAGVSGGFSANLFIGSIDPLLAGLTQSAAQIIKPDMAVNAATNFYFMFISTFLVAVVGTWVTERLVEPRLGTYKGDAPGASIEQLSAPERKGLWYALAGNGAVLLLLAAAVLPPWGVLRNPETGEVLHSPFFDGLITAMILVFLVPGIIYGKVTGSIKKQKDVFDMMGKSMGALAGYIVLVFFIAQFIAFFRYSNIGMILAIDGAAMLKQIGFTGLPLILGFILLTYVINIFIASASAKWAIMAPVFVPMFLLLGFHPSLTQAAYRIADSAGNLITPMMSYFALIVTFAQKYDPRAGIGTLISTMLPYSIAFLIGWSFLLFAWMYLGIPLGPDSPPFIR